jgi:hypothetical protein
MHKIPQEAITLSGDHLLHLQNWFSLDNELLIRDTSKDK